MHELDTLVATTLRIDEDEEGLHVGGRDGFDDERPMVSLAFPLLQRRLLFLPNG